MPSNLAGDAKIFQEEGEYEKWITMEKDEENG